jgi:hypothetical protein
VFSPISLVKGNTTHLLTDGGVFDNSGINYLRYLYGKHKWTGQHKRLVIVSDAGREFPTELGPQYETLMALAFRVTDTQGDRIADADSTSAKSFFEGQSIPVVRLSIHDVIKHFPGRPGNHSERVQELLGMIRTELDIFSAEEVFVLYRHGYLAAQKAYLASQHGIPGVDLTPTSVAWTPVEPKQSTKDELEKSLESGHVIKKLTELGKASRGWIVKWIFRRYWGRIAGILTALLLGVSLIATVAYYCGSRSVPPIPAPVATRGDLEIAEIKPYEPEGWAAAIPALTPVLNSAPEQFVYTVTTERIGLLNRSQPHARSIATFKLEGALANARVYLFLEQQLPNGESQHVVLEEKSTRKFRVPPGASSDRVRAVVVNGTEIDEPSRTFRQEFVLSLEVP